MQVTPRGKLFFHKVARAHLLLGKNKDYLEALPSTLRRSLIPWRGVALLREVAQSRQNPPVLTIWTDTSITSWRFLASDHRTVRGQWFLEENKLHINYLELLAIGKAIVTLNLRQVSVFFTTDNVDIGLPVAMND